MCPDFQIVVHLEYCQFKNYGFVWKKIFYIVFDLVFFWSVEIIRYFPTLHDCRGCGSEVEPVSGYQKVPGFDSPGMLVEVS